LDPSVNGLPAHFLKTELSLRHVDGVQEGNVACMNETISFPQNVSPHRQTHQQFPIVRLENSSNIAGDKFVAESSRMILPR
jgi:hypothetical protein